MVKILMGQDWSFFLGTRQGGLIQNLTQSANETLIKGGF
jgi:hypothetical protein